MANIKIALSGSYFLDSVKALPATSPLYKKIFLAIREMGNDRPIFSGSIVVIATFNDNVLKWELISNTIFGSVVFASSKRTPHTAEFGKFLRSLSKQKVINYSIE